MPFGLSISNPSGDLVVSSDAKTLHYLAKAVWQSTTQKSGSIDSGKTPNPAKAGYSMYKITIPAGVTQFVLAIDLPGTGFKSVGIMNVTGGAGGVYDIKAYCGSTSDAAGFDTVQSQIDIWAFGFVSTVSANWGLALYDAAGNLGTDFTRSNLLFPRWISADFKTSASQTIPSGITRPVIIGMPGYFWGDIYDRSTGPLYDYIMQCNFWQRNGTNLQAPNRTLTQYTCNDLNDDAYAINGPSLGIIIEGSTLP